MTNKETRGGDEEQKDENEMEEQVEWERFFICEGIETEKVTEEANKNQKRQEVKW